jgi:hypothetical protein
MADLSLLHKLRFDHHALTIDFAINVMVAIVQYVAVRIFITLFSTASFWFVVVDH